MASSSGVLATLVNMSGTLDLSTLVSKPDDVTVTYTVAEPSHGSVTLEDSVVTYTPQTDYHGNDRFTYTVTNSGDSSDTSTANINVAVNRLPVANDLTVVIENAVDQVTIFLEDHASDPEGDRLSYILGTPSHGSVSLLFDTGGTAIYTPGNTFTDTDSLPIR